MTSTIVPAISLVLLLVASAAAFATPMVELPGQLRASSEDPARLTQEAERYRLGEGCDADFSRAFRLYAQAAEMGYPPAQFNLGLLYESGKGVERNPKQAALWYRKAADQGHAMAQNNLGVLYFRGEGVHKDIRRSTQWYLEAARNGLAQAQFNAGVKLLKGEGVERNEKEGLRWLHRAADQGYSPAGEALKQIFQRKQLPSGK